MLLASPVFVCLFVCSSHLFVALSHLRSQVCSRGSVMLEVLPSPKEQPEPAPARAFSLYLGSCVMLKCKCFSSAAFLRPPGCSRSKPPRASIHHCHGHAPLVPKHLKPKPSEFN